MRDVAEPLVDQTLTCRDCGAKFLYSSYEAGRFGRLRYPRCRDCRQPEGDAPELGPEPGPRQCADCGDSWQLEQAEIDWFVSRAMRVPRRCRECRRARRAAK